MEPSSIVHPGCTKRRSSRRKSSRREVDRYLTGKETEPWEIIYFKLYKGQLSVVERALEIAALMLGSDKSRGYSLEMICADFLAGAALETDNSIPTHESSASIALSRNISVCRILQKKRHERLYFAKEASNPSGVRAVFEAAEEKSSSAITGAVKFVAASRISMFTT